MITSNSNKHIKNITALKTKSKFRHKENSYIVEGIKMINEAPKIELLELYVSESGLLNEQIRTFLSDQTYQIVKDSVFDVISDTITPQGILGIVRSKSYTLENLLDNQGTCYIVLENLQDPGNLGTIIRTAEGAGVSGIIMDNQTVDIYNPKVIRATMGSIYRVPFIISENIQADILKLQQHHIRIYAAHLQGKNNYDQQNYDGKTAFLIGNEGNGLSDDILELADVFIKIPMEGQVESLNAAVAAAILMYEVTHRR